jgi:phosphoribosylaminoimidazole carboxylase PurK protein
MKKTIGIVGGGQLGRMLTDAAHKLGFVVTVLDPTQDSPAGQVADKQIVGSFTDESKIRELAKDVDYVTFEIELANADVLHDLTKKGVSINPSAKTLSIIKDKYKQKEFLKKAHIPTAESVTVESSNTEMNARHPGIAESNLLRNEGSSQIDSRFTIQDSREDSLVERGQNDVVINEIKNIGKSFGYPMLLKARLDAYDGRGNFVLHSENDIPEGLEKLKGRSLYVEKFVPFVKELAVMVARSTVGEILTFPVVETTHKNNICHTCVVPAPVSQEAIDKARSLAIKVMEHLKGAGVFGVEMFLVPSTSSGKKEEVLVNEIAPRVHNSGHYTIEACKTSQFEQHIRAITGMELGATDLIVPAAAMVNILGERNGPAEVEGSDSALAIEGVSVHIYGKKETKIERKMGHITAVGKTPGEALEKALKAREYISI